MPSAAQVLGGALLLCSAATAGLTDISDFGDNPTGLSLSVYVPDSVDSSPAIILALHGCGGSGPAYEQFAGYAQYAEKKGFIVLYPTSNRDSHCWDVSTTASLTHGGGGDSTGLANIVSWALSQYSGDSSRVFVTGSSSGCFMTNVLMATYPDVFTAATCYSGVAAGCLAGSPGNSPATADPTCANGQNTKTGAEWAALVADMYPGYSGSYPRLMTWHGTVDGLVNIQNLNEQLKEWSTVFGVEFEQNRTDYPLDGYTEIIYGDGNQLIGFEAKGVGHTVPVEPEFDLYWFGFSEEVGGGRISGFSVGGD